MQCNCLYVIGIMLSIATIVPDTGCAVQAAAEEETEILKITVGKPTQLSDEVNQSTASVAASRTGTVAAFYPKPGTEAKFYRISKDGGQTWDKELDFPPGYAGPMSADLREGGPLYGAQIQARTRSHAHTLL